MLLSHFGFLFELDDDAWRNMTLSLLTPRSPKHISFDLLIAYHLRRDRLVRLFVNVQRIYLVLQGPKTASIRIMYVPWKYPQPLRA
jgi:hypothetical protein